MALQAYQIKEGLDICPFVIMENLRDLRGKSLRGKPLG
jgi:hypothetical protein